MSQIKPRNATRDEILKVSVSLFARRGYEGVSMREIAMAVGIQAAALYYHFPDKQSLYFAVMEHAFKNRMKKPTDALNSTEPPLRRLKNFLANLVEVLNDEPFILVLLQRERLDADEARKKLLMDHFFAPHFRNLAAVMAELAPNADPILMASSVSGMMLHHLEWRSIGYLYPDWKPEHDDSNYLIQHVFSLLQTLFGVGDEMDER